ncbi:MAG: hypothetical protein Q8M31_01560 [Beijerinckiaceae bacterium]|nr:hypothetical protein [Beijerinckiaceae bacterium]
MRVPIMARAATCTALMMCADAVHAADLQSPSAPPPPPPVFATWEFSATGYLWASSINGTLATVPPLPPVSVDATFVDIVKNLGGAFMGNFEAKYGRFILFSDLMYTRLLPDVGRSRAPLSVGVNIDSYSLIGLAAGGYRIVDGPQFTLDVLAGARGFYMDNIISVRIAAGPFVRGQKFADRQSWLDAVGGVRMRYQIDEKWLVNLIAFAGGGASKYQWDVYGGAGYAFNRNWAAFLGYRAFKVNYRDGDFIYNVLQHGPLAGIQYRW